MIQNIYTSFYTEYKKQQKNNKKTTKMQQRIFKRGITFYINFIK
jgi:hypothetical protein